MAFQSEAELLAALRDSEFWKYVSKYLEDRREVLFACDATEAQTSEKLWKAQGAIAEITRLKNLPNLILAKITMEAQRRQESQVAAMPAEDCDA